MNVLAHLEPDDYEFVEVDPTGRYGRVHLSRSLSLFFSRSCDLAFSLYYYLLWAWFLGSFVCCSTMKSSAKELQKQCMDINLRFFFLQFKHFLSFIRLAAYPSRISSKFELFGSFCLFLYTASDIFVSSWCLIVAVTEHLMSMKELKLLGTRSSFMISCKAPKILKGYTVKFISLRRWSTTTLWNSTLLGLIPQIGTSISLRKCSLLGLWGSKPLFIIFC